MTKARELNEKGIKEFTKYLNHVREDKNIKLPNLDDSNFSKQLKYDLYIQQNINFYNKYELAMYLHNLLKDYNLNFNEIISLSGFWSWLSYIWFDILTNNRKNILKRNEHYICVEPSNFRRYYIHLVAAPCLIFSILEGSKSSLLFLYNSIYEINDFTERVAANQFIISHKSIIDVIYQLYFDKKLNKPKFGATVANKTGNIRRFIRVFNQFEKTYDFYTMTSEDIIKLLPEEFKSWYI